jgi:hypothetical protein
MRLTPTPNRFGELSQGYFVPYQGIFAYPPEQVYSSSNGQG